MEVVLKGLKITLEIESIEVKGEDLSLPNSTEAALNLLSGEIQTLVKSNEELKEMINLKLS